MSRAGTPTVIGVRGVTEGCSLNTPAMITKSPVYLTRRTKMVETNGRLPPRKETKLTERQERFIALLISGKSRREAVREAGYEVADDKQADSRASEILSNPKVYAAYTELRAQLNAESVMDGVKWVAYLRLIAVDAMRSQDWAGAVAALREIGKHLGLYERDNTQKRVDQHEAERLKAELTTRFGVDWSRKNFPTDIDPENPRDGDS